MPAAQGFTHTTSARQPTYLPRFTEIASTPGRPYRDFRVEYPPVSLGVIEAVAGDSASETGLHLLWLCVLLDALLAVALAWGWGATAAAVYLALTVPLIGFMYSTIDLLSAALVTIALAGAVKGRERLAGVGMAAAVFAKVWPLVLVPVFILQRQTRALW